jgi:murein peptide amidase A
MSTVLELSQTRVDRVIARQAALTGQRSVEELLRELDALAEQSDHLFKKPVGSFEVLGRTYTMPRYVFLGPKGGGDTIRIGFFATIHGDEPQGALALSRLATVLERNPNLAQGYALFLYPLCNPTGFLDNTRWSRHGKDLNREFWKDSREPEVRLLETEVWTHAFHGIVNLHADDTSHGLYGFVNGTVLSQFLVQPALRSAEKFLPRNCDGQIDGFPADQGIIYESYNGVLQAPAGLHQPPFEITLETPHHAPLDLQVEALHAALQTILAEYRSLIAIAQNI